MAAFLGRMASYAPTFLGVAKRGATFLGRAATTGSKLANGFSSVAYNPAVQGALRQIGGARAVDRLNKVAGTVGAYGGAVAQAQAQIPGMYRDVRDQFNQGVQTAQGVKRTLADIYQQARS